MQNMKKLIAIMLMLASVFFIACDNDDDDKKEALTASEAKTELTNITTEMSSVISNMESSEALVVLGMIDTLPYPFTSGTKSTQETNIFKNIENLLLPVTILNKEKSKVSEPIFDFETYKGVYTYHNTPFPYWEIVPGGSIIEINFPSTEANMAAGTNDAKLTISNYSEVEITEYDDYYQEYDYYNMPNAIVASLELNSVEIISVDMSATWVTSGDAAGEPTDLDVDVYLIPFTFHIDFSHASTTADINAWIKYNGAKIFSVGLDAEFATTDMDNPPTKIAGYIQLFDVKFIASVKFKEFEELMESIETYTDIEEFETALNLLIDASIEVDGAEAADIIIDITTSETVILLDETNGIYLDIKFVYSDGTSESGIPYFLAFITELEEFVASLEEYYGGW